MALLAPVQAGIAERHGNDYAWVLAWTLGIVAVALTVATLLGKEAKSAVLASTSAGR
jgi:SHS family lactate transporter-like MFS transporter